MKKIKAKKGFTLIEILAVIIILAVIALIATPIIINVMESARKKAFENSVYGVMETYKLNMLNNIEEIEIIGKSYTFPEANSNLKYSGTKMTGGSIFLDYEKDIEVRQLTDGRYCASGNKTNLVVKKGDCQIDMANAPVLRVADVGVIGDTFITRVAGTENIESIEVIMVGEFPDEAVDVSDKKNGSVMLWTKDKNDDDRPEVYIGAINDYVYANPNTSHLFYRFYLNLEEKDLSNFDTSLATNMYRMFDSTGSNNIKFTLNLGKHFDTNNVENMENMFYRIGYNSTVFTLNLGNKFDTSNVTNMGGMFYDVGYNSSKFTLSLGNKFDTSNVTNMGSMFRGTGYNSTVFTLNLGNKFDTSNVTNMSNMFHSTGSYSQRFTLNLENRFNTSKVTNMREMFTAAGANNPNFTLNLGKNFDTGNVTDMNAMFSGTGRNSEKYTLDLGSKFSVDSAKNTFNTFGDYTGTVKPGFKPTATVKTQAEKDAILAKFPNIDITIKP
jgi:prepilin-type N-terminal cleavage/methylation domain